MVQIHNLGFPRIGKNRELKFALENYWKKNTSEQQLQDTAKELRQTQWHRQKDLSFVPVGDFSLYDHMLDHSFLFGHIPERIKQSEGNSLAHYFQVARGRAQHQDQDLSKEHDHKHNADSPCTHASEMTKWFDTNYHYIVPELTAKTAFSLHADSLLAQVKEAIALGHQPKPVLIGPLTYLKLSKLSHQPTEANIDNIKLGYLNQLLFCYVQLLEELHQLGVQWVQIDEPILATQLDSKWQQSFEYTYQQFKSTGVNILLATYFGELSENLSVAISLPVAGIHIDAVRGGAELQRVIELLPADKVLSVGIVDGRNIWKTDLNHALNILEPIAEQLGERLWIAPSCSLIHVPVDLNTELETEGNLVNAQASTNTASSDQLTKNIFRTVSQWLAFAEQKIDELLTLAAALNQGRSSVQQALEDNASAIASRAQSPLIHRAAVAERVAQIKPSDSNRNAAFAHRIEQQQQRLKLPLYPTTTIGSFPQTAEIRQARKQFKEGKISETLYRERMKAEIAHAVTIQEQLNIDVFVHGEAERNDMVEYFGQHLDGCTFSQFGWVQSYGSRCVKPPIIFGDIVRPNPITVDWSVFAQSLTQKPMKGMITGPVTILNWSFVRDDQPRKTTCLQIALAMRDEVLDLEQAGIRIIQIDEAALREGLPLRQRDWPEYLSWAIESFRLTANGVQDDTQIHTHMCYSEFNYIIENIAQMDADVITIETSRSQMELLNAFNDFDYPNDIGPGVYDIHSPNIPSTENIISLLTAAQQHIPAQRLWVNPDCGLKTRQWSEVKPALENMVQAALTLRDRHNSL